jgi:archaellum component FlaC
MLVSTHQIRGEGSARSARSLLTPELSVHTETSGTVADRQELGQDLSILEKDGSHERSYDRVCSAVQRDFSFKSTLQEESAAREMQDTAAATMTEAMRKGILDVHSRVVLLIEICGEHAWQSKNQQIVLELKKALQLVKTRQSKDTDGVTSEGFSIMQYATVAQHEGRLGAFEVYAQFFSNKTANPLSILLHSKLQTQRFPNANAMMRFLCEMLPRVTDARKFRLVLADLSDDNIELRSDLKNSSEQCKSVEHRLKNVVDKYEALQIADQGRQHTVLRAIKELTRIKKHVDKLADQLNENLTNEESLLTENTADHSCAQREACDGMIQNSSNLCASNNPPRETCAEVCDKGGSAFALCEKIQVGVSLVMKNLSGERVCEEFQQWQEELRFERAQCSKTIASMDAELQSLDEKLEALSHRMLHLQANAAGAETELQSLREQLSASHNSHEHLTLQLAEAISERDELVAELKKAADAQVLDSFSQAQDVAQKVDNPLLAMAGQMEELENSLAKMMVAIPQVCGLVSDVTSYLFAGRLLC